MSRTRWRMPVALLAVTAAGVAQGFVRADPDDTSATVFFLLAAGAVALILRTPGDAAEVPQVPSRGANRAWAIVAVGAGAIVLLYGSAALLTSWRAFFYTGWSLLFAGVAAMSIGLWGFDGKPPRTWRWSEALIVAGILAVGTALRFHQYSDWPGPFTTHAIEEQQTGLGGFRVLTRGHRPWEFWIDYQLTALALSFDAQPTFNTIRLPYTVVSALTVVPVYFLLRQWMQVPAAAFGAGLYALSSWNLVYSRCAHPIFATNFLVIVVLAMLFQYGRTRRLWVLPWVGLLCGYTLYSYAGYRGTPFFAAVFFVGCGLGSLWGWGKAVAETKSVWRRRAGRDAVAAVLFGTVTLAVALPITGAIGPAGQRYYFEAVSRALANREYYTDDLGRLLEQRAQRIRDSARIFMHVGDSSHTFNVPGRPMLDPATAVLFTVGLFLSALEVRRGYNAFLLFMFSALMLVGTVFVHNLDVRRLQGVTVFVIAFAAVTFERLWALAGGQARRGLSLIALVVVAFVGVWSYDHYFHRMAGDPAIREAFHDHYTTLIHWGSVRSEKRPILLLSFVHRFFEPGYHYRHNYSWLIDRHLTGQDLGDVTDLLREETFLPEGPRTVLVQEPFEREQVAQLLQAAYPGTQCEQFVEPDSARTALTICELPRHIERPRVTPRLDARYSFEGPSQHRWALQRQEPFLGFGTYPRLCYTPRPGLFCHGEWEGVFTVSEGDQRDIAVLTTGRAQASATVDGRNVPPGGLSVGPGEHRLRVQARLPCDWEAGVRLVWRRSGSAEPIPFY